MSRFFIDRPIFAWVIAIIIMVAGVIAITRLPIAQYPTIAPPAVTVSAIYPGASAQVGRGLGHADHRAGHERARRPHLHVLDQRVERPVDDHAHVPERHRSRHRAGAGAEQAAARDAAAAADRAAAGHQRQQGGAGLPDGRRLRLRRRQHGRATTSPTTSPRTSSTRSRASPASATCRCSARSTPCASGSIPASSRPTGSRPTT